MKLADSRNRVLEELWVLESALAFAEMNPEADDGPIPSSDTVTLA